MPRFFQTPIDKVLAEVLEYRRKMKAIADYLDKPETPKHLKIDADKEYMQFFIDLDAFKRMAALWTMPGTKYIAVYLGMANLRDEIEDKPASHGVTGCFVAVDEGKNVIRAHFPTKNGAKALMDPEDTWIPPGTGTDGLAAMSEKDFKLSASIEDLVRHFTPPQSE